MTPEKARAKATWEVVGANTLRQPVPGGWLYRIGDSSHLTFVPVPEVIAIPPDVYYSTEADNFFGADGYGKGNAFYNCWYQYRRAFPPLITATI